MSDEEINVAKEFRDMILVVLAVLIISVVASIVASQVAYFTAAGLCFTLSGYAFYRYKRLG
jgi:hypothetical protein